MGMFREIIKSALERLALLALALVAVRAFGPDLVGGLGYIKAHPASTLAFLTAAALLRMVVVLVPAFTITRTRGSAAVEYGVVVAGHAEWGRRTSCDIKRTAVHEAGHLLYYAGADTMPADLTVSVRTVLDAHDQYRGQVSHSGPPPAVMTQRYLYWSMLMHLAGTEAEFVALSSRGDGAQTDHARWLAYAHTYLASGFGEVFYEHPGNDAQVAHNRAVLNDLKARCLQDVHAFLEANRTVLDELADRIAERKHLGRTEIEPFLARVVGAPSAQDR